MAIFYQERLIPVLSLILVMQSLLNIASSEDADNLRGSLQTLLSE